MEPTLAELASAPAAGIRVTTSPIHPLRVAQQPILQVLGVASAFISYAHEDQEFN
jgi:hypothetical protein